MRSENPTIPPDWHLLKLDEREYWHPEIQAQTKAIWGVYAFDRNSRTYCCEITPSYELRFIADDAEEIDDLDDEAREALHEKLLGAASEPVAYMHVRAVEALIERHPERLRRVEVDAESDDKALDEIAEGWGTGALLY